MSDLWTTPSTGLYTGKSGPRSLPYDPGTYANIWQGRGQVHREELHGHQPFRARTRSLQSWIQQKIKKTQRMRQRYGNTQ